MRSSRLPRISRRRRLFPVFSDLGSLCTVSEIDGIDARLERARENIINLTGEISAFLRMGCDGIVAPDDFDHIEQSVQHLSLPGQPTIPSRLGALAGETIYLMRSALDHLAWHLVLAAGGEPGPRSRFGHGEGTISISAGAATASDMKKEGQGTTYLSFARFGKLTDVAVADGLWLLWHATRGIYASFAGELTRPRGLRKDRPKEAVAPPVAQLAEPAEESSSDDLDRAPNVVAHFNVEQDPYDRNLLSRFEQALREPLGTISDGRTEKDGHVVRQRAPDHV
jgi:hypothetical protein